MNGSVLLIGFVFETEPESFLRQNHDSFHALISDHSQNSAFGIPFEFKVLIEHSGIKQHFADIGVFPGIETKNRNNGTGSNEQFIA
ncbi:hypothetical protein D3C80_931710 [compost metagenome]